MSSPERVVGVRPVEIGGREHRIRVYDRQTFLHEVFTYLSGQHLTILGPNGGGKTTLGYELMDITATPQLPGVVLVMKPRDSTVVDFNDQLGFRIVRDWPPGRNLRAPLAKERGWTLWPEHVFDPSVDDPHLYEVFRRCILDRYKRGNCIVKADELPGLQRDLNLEQELKAVYKRGRSMGCGMWGMGQRPFDMLQEAYSQAEHLFLSWTPDERDRKRFSEIGGGLDPKLINEIVLRLAKFEFLYLRRSDRVMCIVLP